MICKECEHCEYIEYDGYFCKNIDAFIPPEIVDKDIDCMVYDMISTYKFIRLDSDNCKNVGITSLRRQLF